MPPIIAEGGILESRTADLTFRENTTDEILEAILSQDNGRFMLHER